MVRNAAQKRYGTRQTRFRAMRPPVYGGRMRLPEPLRTNRVTKEKP